MTGYEGPAGAFEQKLTVLTLRLTHHRKALYERIPVCKVSIVLTSTSSCSSVSGLIAARAAGHYEIR